VSPAVPVFLFGGRLLPVSSGDLRSPAIETGIANVRWIASKSLFLSRVSSGDLSIAR
jgi:hypothetical protein